MLRSYVAVTTPLDPFPLLTPPRAPTSVASPPPTSDTVVVHPLTQSTALHSYLPPRWRHSPFIFLHFVSSRGHPASQKHPDQTSLSGDDPATARPHLTCVSHGSLRPCLLSLLPAGGQLEGQIRAWHERLEHVRHPGVVGVRR